MKPSQPAKTKHRIYSLPVARVYPLYIAKGRAMEKILRKDETK